MRFYYFSIFSWALYSVFCIVALVLVWIIWAKLFKWNLKNPIYWLLVGAVVALPWSEELWIAYNFDKECRKDAGRSVSKTVAVDGFYDDTTHWWRQLAESKYRFVESRDQIDNKLWRVERVVGDVRHYQIERPTARYSFSQPHAHSSVAHKVSKIERIVSDRQTGEVLARETKYARQAPWLFVGLDAPLILCPAPEENRSQAVGSIHRLALEPLVTK